MRYIFIMLVCTGAGSFEALYSMDILQEKPKEPKHWIVSIHDTSAPLSPRPKRSLVFIPKHTPVVTPVTPEEITAKRQSILGAMEEGNTPELLRSTNNNIMGALQENLKNAAAIATMSTAQWKRLMALVIVWGSFSVVQLGLQAYNASRSCT